MTNLLMEIGKLFKRRLFEENPFADESVSQDCQNSVCQAVISINHCEEENLRWKNEELSRRPA